MVSKLSILFTAAILFLFSLVSPVVGSQATDILDRLTARVDKNTTAIPSSITGNCSGGCDSILQVFTECTSDACACNDPDSDLLNSCMNCLVQQNTLQQVVANAIQSDYVRICGNMNHPVKNNVNAGSQLTASRLITGLVAIVAFIVVV